MKATSSNGRRFVGTDQVVKSSTKFAKMCIPLGSTSSRTTVEAKVQPRTGKNGIIPRRGMLLKPKFNIIVVRWSGLDRGSHKDEFRGLQLKP